MSVSTPLRICLHACKCPRFVAITPTCVAGSGILIVVFAFAKWISQGHIARQDAPSPYRISVDMSPGRWFHDIFKQAEFAKNRQGRV